MAALLSVRTCSRGLRETARRLLLTENQSYILPGKRFLLTNRVLKFDDFIQSKIMALHFLQETKDGFFKKMEVKLRNSEAFLEEEIKPMLHLCESPSDVQFAKKCLESYYSENKTPEFKFGPIFLRLCYEYDLVDTAFEVLMHESYKVAFSDATSFNILLEILHKHGQYEKSLEALLEMKAQRVRFYIDTYLMAFAVFYELNSPRSLETCMNLLEEALKEEIALSRLTLCFAVALAWKQGEYQKALYVHEKISSKNNSLCHNLTLLIASGMENLEKVMQLLESTNELPDSESLRKLKLSQEVMDALEEKLRPTDLFERFSNIYEQLKQSGQVSPLTMHKMLYNRAKEQKNGANYMREKYSLKNRLYVEGKV